MFEISFFVSNRLSMSKLTSGLRGRISDSIMRPAVVWTRLITLLPSLSMTGIRASDLGVQRQRAAIEPMLDLAHVGEGHAFALRARLFHRDVVEAEDDVLRRHDDRLAVRGREDVVRRHHQHARLELRLERQRHVHRHLIAVEVGVEGRADQRMQLDRLAFDRVGSNA